MWVPDQRPLGLTLDHMSSPWTRGFGLYTCFRTRLCLRLTRSHTLTHHSTSTPFPEPHVVSPAKRTLFGCLLRVDQTPLLPPETGLNLNLGSYQSDEWASQIYSQAFSGSSVQPELASLAHWERGSLPWINTVQWHLAGTALPVGWVHWAFDQEVKTPPSESQGSPQNVSGGLRQWLRTHQSFQEASLLSKSATTQWIHVQTLRPRTKGTFLIYHLEQVKEMGELQLVPYIITCYFIGCFNLWSEVTLF
jgi:hypothetical protein